MNQKITILKVELDEVQSCSVHTPLLRNYRLCEDNVSNSQKVIEKLVNNVVKALEFVETFRVLKKLYVDHLRGADT